MPAVDTENGAVETIDALPSLPLLAAAIATVSSDKPEVRPTTEVTAGAAGGVNRKALGLLLGAALVAGSGDEEGLPSDAAAPTTAGASAVCAPESVAAELVVEVAAAAAAILARAALAATRRREARSGC